MAQDLTDQAKRFIDASLKGRSKPPSKAAYARAEKFRWLVKRERH